MPEDANSEKLKKLVALKERLEKKTKELETELGETQMTLETVNSILLEKGFKRVSITKTTTEPKPLPPIEEAEPEHELIYEQDASSESVIPLKTVTGELLAIIHTNENSLRVLPAEDKNFNTTTSPFTQFLIERVLAKMQEKDSELVKIGQLTQDKSFSYNIMKEGEAIREISIINVDTDRLRELKSSIRWTFEKMYEKMKGPK